MRQRNDAPSPLKCLSITAQILTPKRKNTPSIEKLVDPGQKCQEERAQF